MYIGEHISKLKWWRQRKTAARKIKTRKTKDFRGRTGVESRPARPKNPDNDLKKWAGADLNRRHTDFQSVIGVL